MYDVDPQVSAGLAEVFGEDPTTPERGDWLSRREGAHAMFDDLWRRYPVASDVDSEDVVISATDGTPLTVRLYRQRDSEQSAVVLYLHGGGMIMCDLDTHDGVCRGYASATGIPVVAVDYRLAPEHPFPIPVDDCYATLVWLSENATSLGLDPARIIVAGESAGGGLAVAVALRARDTGGPALAGQLLVYPMLDDRTYVRDEELEAVAVWTFDDHRTAWECYLGQTAVESHYATPLRAADVGGLPPTYLDCGELDIFRAECTAYALRLLEAGVRLEFHLHPGVPHAFELFAPDADVSRRAMEDRFRFLLHIANRNIPIRGQI